MLRSRSIRKPGEARQGAAAMELAIAIPVVVTIVFGCVDFGRFAYTYIAVTNAARAGADFASTNPIPSYGQTVWNTKVREAVADELGTAFNSSEIEVPLPVTRVDPNGFKRVRVQVSYPFHTVFHWPMIPDGSLKLTRAVEMRVVRL